ncbi:MAG: antibiotic biosynthesis monooxygenase [Actinomycetota bacterium]|nr:antibiotic biosynthesis monooxygenase [Actinomycetota bacterium]
MIVRIFDTAVDPRNIELGKQLFRDQVAPAFSGFSGCHGIEMLIAVEEGSGGYVDVTAISRWDSIEAIEGATETPEYNEALKDLRELFEKTPIVTHYEPVG